MDGKMLDGAGDVRPGVGRFLKESDAEDVLRARWNTDIDPGRPGIPVAAGGALNQRYIDILRPRQRVGYEVKFGKVNASGRAKRQVNADKSAVDLREGGMVDEVGWHFFAGQRGVFGPDEALLNLLQATGRPYVIHLP